MAKEKTTLYLDEDVLRQTAAAAAGSGRDESEVVEDALRRYLGLEVVDRVWARNAANALDPDEALALAYAELKDHPRRARAACGVGAPSRRRPGRPRLGAHHAARSSRPDRPRDPGGAAPNRRLPSSPRRAPGRPAAREVPRVRHDRGGRAVRRRPRLDSGDRPDPADEAQIARDPKDDYLLALARESSPTRS